MLSKLVDDIRARLFPLPRSIPPPPRSDASVLETFEAATPETFDERCYLLANPDLSKAGVDAARHFREEGIRQNRRQLNRRLLYDPAYRTAKFERFKSIIDLPEDQLTGFPLTVGKPFSLSDYQAESANCDFDAFVAAIAANPGKNYLDLGCGLRQRMYQNCLYLEVYPSVSADLVAGLGCEYPIKSESFDGIGCFAVLEHTRQPWKVVQEMHRMLRPGGQVYIDWPFLQPVHGFPSHYFNATREGLKSAFTDLGFAVNNIGTFPNQTPDYTVTWIVGRLLRALPKRKRRQFGRMRVSNLVAQNPENQFWKELLRDLPDDVISELACGNSLIATKPKSDS
jgi:SAM-dependent methyltransferase